MSESKETNHLQPKKKSRKIKKAVNLLDFVVFKQKNKKTHQITTIKISKKIQKRGKVRKKRITTLKKKILRERVAKHSDEKCLEISVAEKTDIIIEKIAEIQLEDPIKTKDPSIIAVPHSKNFRDYCNHFITTEIKRLTELMLKDLLKFQENKFHKNPGNKQKWALTT